MDSFLSLHFFMLNCDVLPYNIKKNVSFTAVADCFCWSFVPFGHLSLSRAHLQFKITVTSIQAPTIFPAPFSFGKVCGLNNQNP